LFDCATTVWPNRSKNQKTQHIIQEKKSVEHHNYKLDGGVAGRGFSPELIFAGVPLYWRADVDPFV
jgi:hypothetical protein